MKQELQLESLTFSERVAVRKTFAFLNKTVVTTWRNPDGTWAADVGGLVFEGTSRADLFRELAGILEEA